MYQILVECILAGHGGPKKEGNREARGEWEKHSFPLALGSRMKLINLLLLHPQVWTVLSNSVAGNLYGMELQQVSCRLYSYKVSLGAKISFAYLYQLCSFIHTI